ncbi:helix-turn-helix protein [Stackebrandtia albiflava]|uniref:Helix-turn-helix protein n=1 Tax=Stackebrandtia albiflava TaxID=406432 RepID=A0A562URE2_9ACTN|nr:helix-turn-helix transcriptional regulator [Stackebrandtia albiflava]TWJ08192.1 helix-turn-helix protein [Stackebrandtia albiflava]
MSKNRSLSLRNQWLGERLKAARVAAGLTLKAAGEQLNLTDATLSRFEKGTVRVRHPYVKEMIHLYGVSDPLERDALLQFNKDSWRKDWWDGDTTDIDRGFLDYTWLEARSKRIRIFSPLLIHGLLQSPGYIRAVVDHATEAEITAQHVDRQLEIRLARQKTVFQDRTTPLSVVLEEAAILRMVGGRTVMCEQLEHLVAVSELPHIQIRLLPITAEWDAGYAGPFSYFEMPDPFPEVAYIENLAGRTFLEESGKVSRIRQVHAALVRSALSPTKTRNFIRDALKELQ